MSAEHEVTRTVLFLSAGSVPLILFIDHTMSEHIIGATFVIFEA